MAKAGKCENYRPPRACHVGEEDGRSCEAGESHSPSGRAGRGLDEHSVSVVAFQPRSPAGQAGRGLTRLVSYNEGIALGLENRAPSLTGMGCTAEQNRNVTTTSTRSNSSRACPTLACAKSTQDRGSEWVGSVRVFFCDTRYVPGPKALGSPSPSGHRPRCTTHVKDPSGLVPLVNKVGWLRQASAKTTDPHVLVTWVKKIGGHAQAGESHSPSGRAGRGLDEHSVSVVAFQPRSPAGQAGRGLPRPVSYNEGIALGLENRAPSLTGMGCTAEQNRNVTTTSTRSNSSRACPTPRESRGRLP